MTNPQKIRRHNQTLLPGSGDAIDWLGRIHQVGLFADMPPASQGDQSGVDGVTSGTDFSSVTGNFGQAMVASTITLDGTSFTIDTVVDATHLTLTSSAGTGSNVDWAIIEQPLANHGTTYLATDKTSTILPFAFAAGEQTTTVLDSTDTVCFPNAGFISDNGADFYDVSGIGLFPGCSGIIDVLQDGLYFVLGFIRWESSPSGYLTYCKIKFTPSGSSIDLGTESKQPTVASTTLASQPDPSSTQQITTFLNLDGSAPCSITLEAFQTSGSTQEVLLSAFTIVRIGNKGISS